MKAWLAALALAPLLAGCVATADADADGLADPEEAEVRLINVRTPQGSAARSVTSDPALADTDGDGLGDAEEADALTDPRDADTDGDGLLDGANLTLAPGDARIAEFAQRGIVQGEEGAFLGEQGFGTRPFDWDSDRPFPDGVGDGDEARGWNVTRAAGSRRVASDALVPDTDRDGLADGAERDRGCDPRAPDTDADGVADPNDADCAHNVLLVIGASRLDLQRDLDPGGDTDLLLVAQASGQNQSYTQAVRAGGNDVTFRWVLDVPDQGPWRNLTLTVFLEAWDLDHLGDDGQSGVPRQPVRFAGDANALPLSFALFQDRWTSGALSGAGQAVLQGTDADLTLAFETRLA